MHRSVKNIVDLQEKVKQKINKLKYPNYKLGLKDILKEELKGD